MKFSIVDDQNNFSDDSAKIREVLSPLGEEVDSTEGQLLFVCEGSRFDLSEVDRKGRAVFWVTKNGDQIPSELEEGLADDALVAPIRSLEVLSKVRHFQQLLQWDEVSQINESFADLVKRLRGDLGLAERLQKRRFPVRFPDIKGFRIWSRYLAGMASGGDFFDIAEGKSKGQFSMFLTDSSSYGLSSAVLSALMRVTLKLNRDQEVSNFGAVSDLTEDLSSALGDEDRLSLFYGTFSRRDLKFKYVCFGGNRLYLAKKGKGFERLSSSDSELASSGKLPVKKDEECQLQPADRLVIVSDGFWKPHSDKDMLTMLDSLREKEGVDTINELSYRVKGNLAAEGDFPEEDCTALVLDVNEKFIHLAK